MLLLCIKSCQKGSFRCFSVSCGASVPKNVRRRSLARKITEISVRHSWSELVSEVESTIRKARFVFLRTWVRIHKRHSEKTSICRLSCSNLIHTELHVCLNLSIQSIIPYMSTLLYLFASFIYDSIDEVIHNHSFIFDLSHWWDLSPNPQLQTPGFWSPKIPPMSTAL